MGLGEHDDGASGVRKRVDLVHKMQSIEGHRSYVLQSCWGLGDTPYPRITKQREQIPSKTLFGPKTSKPVKNQHEFSLKKVLTFPTKWSFLENGTPSQSRKQKIIPMMHMRGIPFMLLM